MRQQREANLREAEAAMGLLVPIHDSESGKAEVLCLQREANIAEAEGRGYITIIYS